MSQNQRDCLRIPEGGKFVVVYEDVAFACDGNKCAAAIVNFMRYKSNKVLNRRVTDEKMPWLNISIADLVVDMALGLWKKHAILRAIALLEEKGYVSVRREDGASSQYRLNAEALERAMMLPDREPSTPIEDGVPVAKSDHHRSQNATGTGSEMQPVGESTPYSYNKNIYIPPLPPHGGDDETGLNDQQSGDDWTHLEMTGAAWAEAYAEGRFPRDGGRRLSAVRLRLRGEDRARVDAALSPDLADAAERRLQAAEAIDLSRGSGLDANRPLFRALGMLEGPAASRRPQPATSISRGPQRAPVAFRESAPRKPSYAERQKAELDAAIEKLKARVEREKEEQCRK